MKFWINKIIFLNSLRLKEEKKLLSCVFLYLKYENIIAINANESLDNYRSYHFNT